jgi:single-strand DNA-binding protein
VPNFNKVILIGHLTRDPEMKTFANGGGVCNFSIAVNREWKNANGEKQKEVGFFDVKAFGKTGELVSRYMAKGRAILVDGRLTQECWEDKQSGQKRSAVRIVAEGVTFIGNPSDKKPDSDADQAGEETQIPGDGEIPF